MDDAQLFGRIQEMVESEHKLRSEPGTPESREQLKQLEESLDQCWDLLRQRRARREFGERTDDVEARPVGEVETYQQ